MNDLMQRLQAAIEHLRNGMVPEGRITCFCDGSVGVVCDACQDLMLFGEAKREIERLQKKHNDAVRFMDGIRETARNRNPDGVTILDFMAVWNEQYQNRITELQDEIGFFQNDDENHNHAECCRMISTLRDGLQAIVDEHRFSTTDDSAIQFSVLEKHIRNVLAEAERLTKNEVKERATVEEVEEPSAITTYWRDHYLVNDICSLCGNRGFIEVNYCICPDGQSLRELRELEVNAG